MNTRVNHLLSLPAILPFLLRLELGEAPAKSDALTTVDSHVDEQTRLLHAKKPLAFLLSRLMTGQAPLYGAVKHMPTAELILKLNNAPDFAILVIRSLEQLELYAERDNLLAFIAGKNKLSAETKAILKRLPIKNLTPLLIDIDTKGGGCTRSFHPSSLYSGYATAAKAWAESLAAEPSMPAAS